MTRKHFHDAALTVILDGAIQVMLMFFLLHNFSKVLVALGHPHIGVKVGFYITKYRSLSEHLAGSNDRFECFGLMWASPVYRS